MRYSNVFVTGGTGYLGRAFIRVLLARGYSVRALVRSDSIGKLPSGAIPVIGNALDASTFAHLLFPSETIVHLVGTPHPNPFKSAAFRSVDWVSIQETVKAAKQVGTPRIVYVSVAQPAPIMQSYSAVRQAGEALIRASGINGVILRPWYVLGPRHWWPLLLTPLYAVLNRIPSMKKRAEELGLVTLPQMCDALLYAVEEPVEGVRILGVPEIKVI